MNRENKTNNLSRKTNLELYRIIFMYLIVLHHYVVNSGLIEQMKIQCNFTKNLVYAIAGGWGKLGINCFVLITVFFMCKSNITPQNILSFFQK